MPALLFPSETAVEVALRAGWIPPEVQRAPLGVQRAGDGSLTLIPEVPLSPLTLATLKTGGVLETAASAEVTRLSCWLEVIQPRRASTPDELGEVLFALRRGADRIAFSAELLRLGCERQWLAQSTTEPFHTFIRAADPPWFMVMRALEYDSHTTVFQRAQGRGNMWLELGFSHHLLNQVDLPADMTLLVTGQGAWHRAPPLEWTELDKLIVPAGLPSPQQRSPKVDVAPIPIQVRLARGVSNAAPSLFVVHSTERSAVQLAESFVRSLPESELDALTFAVVDDVVLLRARPGREAHVAAIPGEAYTRLFEIPNLYVPAGQTVEPPLRRDRLREWFAPDLDQLTWLEPVSDSTNQSFRQLVIPEGAFRPLTEWVDYVIDQAAVTLTAWAKSATFDFEDFEATSAAPSSRASGFTDLKPPPPPSEALDDDAAELGESARDAAGSMAQKKRDAARADAKSAVAAKAENAKKEAAAKAEAAKREKARAAKSAEDAAQAQVPSAAVVRTVAAIDEAIQAEEAKFFALENESNVELRQAAWLRLARLYSQGQRLADAGHAWARVIWEADPADVELLAGQWAKSCGTTWDAVTQLKRQLTPDEARGFVALLLERSLREGAGSTVSSAEASAVLDASENDLDVRTAWLGRFALARLSGGDPLALARARDRLLARLQRGLSLDRDVPRLLRLSGSSSAQASERLRLVVTQFEQVLKAILETPRKRSTIEAPTELTFPYVMMEFAWGFGRLGQSERAKALRQQALSTIKMDSPVHRYLAHAYSARIDQAVEGVSPETPLAVELYQELSALEPTLRYRVDRLRQSSMVMEPQERLDLFQRAAHIRSSEELAVLRGLKSPSDMVSHIESRLAVVEDARVSEDERARVLDGLLDVLPKVPESHALPLLNSMLAASATIAPVHRVRILDDALTVAGHFGKATVVRQLVVSLNGLIGELGADGVSALNPEAMNVLARTLVAGLRSFRRVGLREEAGDLLARGISVLTGDATPVLQAKLALAGGFVYLGKFDRAKPILDDAVGRLSKETGLTPIDRLRLTRYTARAFGQATTEVALAGLKSLLHQLPWITDNWSTKDFFCLSLIDYSDSLVLGHVGDDLTLTDGARRFVEEDEFLVRRRIHRDVGAGS